VSHTLPAEFLRTISKEEVTGLPIRKYEGEIRLVVTQREAEAAFADILAERVTGFDTETRPAFRKGESYLPALVQVATARAVYLFQLARGDYAGDLTEYLESAQVVKAGVSIADDLRTLKQVFPFEPRAVVDPGLVARRHGLKQSGVRNLAALFLRFRIPKGNKTSNWAAQRLNAAQLTYAATDAWACREIYLRFEELGLL
jgi:ribonuclease D